MSKFIDPAKVPKRRLYTGEKSHVSEWGPLVPTVLARRKFRTRFTGAVQCYYRLFDCASVYQNEDQIGRCLKKRFGTVW